MIFARGIAGTREEMPNSSRTQCNDYKDTLPYIFVPACKQHNAAIHDNILPGRNAALHHLLNNL